MRNAECGMRNGELFLNLECGIVFEFAMRNAQLDCNPPIVSTRLEGISFVEYSRVCRRRARIEMDRQWGVGKFGMRDVNNSFIYNDANEKGIVTKKNAFF